MNLKFFTAEGRSGCVDSGAVRNVLCGQSSTEMNAAAALSVTLAISVDQARQVTSSR